MKITPEEKLAIILYEIAHLPESEDYDPSGLVKYNGEVLQAVLRMRETPEVFEPWVELAKRQMDLIGLKGGAVRTKTQRRPRSKS